MADAELPGMSRVWDSGWMRCTSPTCPCVVRAVAMDPALEVCPMCGCALREETLAEADHAQ